MKKKKKEILWRTLTVEIKCEKTKRFDFYDAFGVKLFYFNSSSSKRKVRKKYIFVFLYIYI